MYVNRSNTNMKVDHIHKFEKLTEIAAPYTALLYDVDGTLADNMHAHKAAYQATASEYGIELDVDIVDELAGWPTVNVAAEIARRYRRPFVKEAFAKRKSQLFLSAYIQQTTPISYVVEHLLSNIGKKRIALVSGGTRNTLKHTIEIIGLSDKYETLVCAGDTPQGKPSPQPFLRAAEILDVPPQSCIVFEDGDPGVQGAIAAGMGWVRVDQL